MYMMDENANKNHQKYSFYLEIMNRISNDYKKSN